MCDDFSKVFDSLIGRCLIFVRLFRSVRVCVFFAFCSENEAKSRQALCRVLGGLIVV
jgi:hypothetical protein